MKILRLLDKLAVVLKRDLLIKARYAGGLWSEAITVACEIGFMYFLARAIGPQFRPDGVAYFPFLLIGSALYVFGIGGLSAFVSDIREAQITGTLEVLLSTSSGSATVMLLQGFSAFAGRFLRFVLVLGVGLVIFRHVMARPHLLMAVLVFVLTMVMLLGLAMMVAAVQIVIQKGMAVVWLLSSVMSLLSGVMFPVSVLPFPIQKIADLVPLRYSLDSFRLALVGNVDSSALLRPVAALAVYAVIAFPLGAWCFAQGMRMARRQGTLSFY